MDKYLMNTHKLYWHLDRVYKWLSGERIPPIHIDAGLSKGCNIRCEYCYGATQGNLFKRRKDITFPREPLIRYVKTAGKVGVRSIAFIGEAEPTLNPFLYEAIVEAKKSGIDVALGTNGILFDDGKNGEMALEHLTWIRFNISAASEKAYLRIHRSKEYSTAIKKIKFCVETKGKRNLDITIGLQMVLTPNNIDQVIPLAKLGKDLGVDYFVIKQCSDTRNNDIGVFDKLSLYKNYECILKEAENESSDNYDVIVKWYKITNEGKRNYDKCLGVPFLIYTSGDGKVFPCGMFFDFRSEEFVMGNLLEKGFDQILESNRYWEIVDKVASQINVHTECYANCRTNEINEFLWKVKNPPPHVNFI